MKKILIILTQPLIFGCCNKEDHYNQKPEVQTRNYVDELIDELNRFLEVFYPGTKSSDYGIKNVFTLTSEGQTKSYDVSDTVMHIMNFNDGYAVFGHRMSTMEILAFVEQGELDMTVFENPDFDKYLSRRSVKEEDDTDDEEEAVNGMTEDQFRTFLSEMILSGSLRMKEEYEVVQSKTDGPSIIGPGD